MRGIKHQRGFGPCPSIRSPMPLVTKASGIMGREWYEGLQAAYYNAELAPKYPTPPKKMSSVLQVQTLRLTPKHDIQLMMMVPMPVMFNVYTLF